jgi:hypothetical protein
MRYIDFASKISFYEFLISEFKKPHFKTRDYEKELILLKKDINIEYLTEILGTTPKIIDIFEELFQLKRFTNAQYINFCFDVHILNNYEQDLVLKYIKTRVFKFENGSKNKSFLDIYNQLVGDDESKNEGIIFNVKRAIIDYIEKCQSKREVFYSHLQNSIDSRLRIAKYLIEHLNADAYLKTVNLEKFLDIKRHPIDTKGLHGKFGIIKISKILEEGGFINIDSDIPDKILPMKKVILGKESKNDFSYLREKAIKGISKRKDKKPKVFDFLLLYKGNPKVLVETNFYTTSGTKIGINQGEYVDLLQDVSKTNAKENTNFLFLWVTDGNYWLTKDGENRFNNLKRNYFKDELELLNYNLLKVNLGKIKEKMKHE